MPTFWSRSRIETLQECPRKELYQYGWQGRGIVPYKTPYYFVTGTAFHEGVESIMNDMRLQQQVSLDRALAHIDSLFAQAQPRFSVEELVLDDEDAKGQDNQIERAQLKAQRSMAAWNEQKFLASMLLLLWSNTELVRVHEQYGVAAVEHDVAMDLGVDNILEIKPDAVLWKKQAPHGIVNYSFKTSKDASELNWLSHRLSLQVVIEQLYSILVYGQPTEHTELCVLVKGSRSRNPHPKFNRHIQESALCYGYTNGKEWAHENKIHKPMNKSGYGYLGSGWEIEPLWEHFTPWQWFEMLAKDETVGYDNYADLVSRLVVRSNPVVVTQTDITETLAELRRLILSRGTLAVRNRQSCVWPTRCAYIDNCFRGVTPESQLESGTMVWREPHHARESEYIRIQTEKKQAQEVVNDADGWGF